MYKQILVMRTVVVVILGTTLICGIALINTYDGALFQKMWSGRVS